MDKQKREKLMALDKKLTPYAKGLVLLTVFLGHVFLLSSLIRTTDFAVFSLWRIVGLVSMIDILFGAFIYIVWRDKC